jgi:predicted RNase H-like nuclease (RuvC/YqgF family)
MNPLFRKLYKHKKTRVRDPNLPPPPNLFSTVKDLKDTKEVVGDQGSKIERLERRLGHLEARNSYLENYVELLRQQVNMLRRK